MHLLLNWRQTALVLPALDLMPCLKTLLSCQEMQLSALQAALHLESRLHHLCHRKRTKMCCQIQKQPQGQNVNLLLEEGSLGRPLAAEVLVQLNMTLLELLYVQTQTPGYPAKAGQMMPGLVIRREGQRQAIPDQAPPPLPPVVSAQGPARDYGQAHLQACRIAKPRYVLLKRQGEAWKARS